MALDSEHFCSQMARRAGLSLVGTAPDSTMVWLALEYPRPWGAKALAESDLAQPIKERISDWLKSIPNSRFQFVKQQGSPMSRSPAFFVALATDVEPVLYEVRLDGYGDLLGLDLPALLARDPAYQAQRREGPLFLVCTNGRRDRCCAKWGLTVYHAMRSYAGDSVWQTTHTGGHRYAATLVCLPDGVCYGWIGEEDVTGLVDAQRSGKIYDLAQYRGRSTYRQVVQAAEIFLRRETGERRLSAFPLVAAEETGDGTWVVEFSAQGKTERRRLTVLEQPSQQARFLSCGADEPEPVASFSLIAYELA